MRPINHLPLKMIGSIGALFIAGCQAAMPALATVDQVDLERFMGDWYVIANIPTFVEKGAYNAVESYELDEDGSVATTFTFRKGAFDGPRKQYTPRGFVRNTESNAEWGMQFVWPVKSDYRIIWLSDDYSQTVIGRNKRDYVWIMARTPHIAAKEFERMVSFIAASGYDTSQLVMIPQSW